MLDACFVRANTASTEPELTTANELRLACNCLDTGVRWAIYTRKYESNIMLHKA